MHVVGVNGCPGGWFAITWDVAAGTLIPAVHQSFTDLLGVYPDAAAIAVDIPIDLAADGPRECDRAARKALGSPRSSSVFPPPHPAVLGALTYGDALELARAVTGKGISKQSFAIYAKVAEVNRALTPNDQRRVVEVHPELSFWALAGGRPMLHSKRQDTGYNERAELLAANLHNVYIPTRSEARQLARPAKPDDVLDSIVAAWTAHRLATGHARRLPPNPPTDANGLRMEMVY
jgi:predicted RNase H-like nuclease